MTGRGVKQVTGRVPLNVLRRDVADKATLIACLYYFTGKEYRCQFGLFLQPQSVFGVWWHAECVAHHPDFDVPVVHTVDNIADALAWLPERGLYFCNVKPAALEGATCYRCGKAEL